MHLTHDHEKIVQRTVELDLRLPTHFSTSYDVPKIVWLLVNVYNDKLTSHNE